MKPADVKSSIYIDCNKVNSKECPEFKVGDYGRIIKIKIFHKAMFQIGLKKFLWLKMLKILFRGHMLLMIWTESLKPFMKGNCKKQIGKS